MNFGLEPFNRSDGPFVQISEDQFREIRRAKNAHILGLSVEEKFGTLLSNYADFEGMLLRYALDDSLFGWTLWNEGIDRLTEVNRLLLNFFATARQYLDQVPHSLNKHFGRPNAIADAFDHQRSREYDSDIGYRLMEELRNHAQHCDFSLHTIRPQGRVVDSSDPAKPIRRSFTATITVDRLAEDPQFKTSVLEELRSMGERVDIRPVARAYVSGLGRVHAHLQELLEPVLEEASTCIRQAVDQYIAEADVDPDELTAVERHEDGRYRDTVVLGDAALNRRQTLRDRHRYAQYYARMHVSNEARASVPNKR